MSARRRFVHVFATFGRGGPQVRAVQLMQRLGPDHEHVVMAMNGDTAARELLPAGVVVEFVAAPQERGFLATRRWFGRWLAAQRPDLVLTYNWGAIEAVAAARSRRLPLVHHEDGFGPEESERRLGRRSWLRRWLLRPLPVIVPSTVLLDITRREWWLPRAKVHHLPNGVDLARFTPGSPVVSPVLGTVGGLRAEKDHQTLLRALATLDPAVTATIVGGGPLEAALREQVASLGLGPRVEFVGPVTDTAPWYRRFLVFVLSSRTEQMPIAMLEAMASGLPVVATDVGDVRRLLPPEAAACIVPPGDAAALAAALRRLLADAALRARLGAANRRVAEQHYEAGRCLDRFLAVYAAAARPLTPPG
ncbi:MAG: glycosyltransferase [Planctomycetes bacterium]|nr:glycosyltransferase [Planctomycetota bacterium]